MFPYPPGYPELYSFAFFAEQLSVSLSVCLFSHNVQETASVCDVHAYTGGMYGKSLEPKRVTAGKEMEEKEILT